MKGLELQIIAHAHNDFVDKFGIPRQPYALSKIETRIVFVPDYRVREALRGIEGFSYIWLIWGFSAKRTLAGSEAQGKWSPTVRPPRLGGNIRVGVFATRSPNRPNPLGLSSVRLLRVEETAAEGLVLVVSGADLLDGTPIYDIKPYLSYSDAHPEAQDGFAGATKDYRLRVEWAKDVLLTEEEKQTLHEILEQDPRPAYQHDSNKEYNVEFATLRVTFRVCDEVLRVERVQRLAR